MSSRTFLGPKGRWAWRGTGCPRRPPATFPSASPPRPPRLTPGRPAAGTSRPRRRWGPRLGAGRREARYGDCQDLCRRPMAGRSACAYFSGLRSAASHARRGGGGSGCEHCPRCVPRDGSSGLGAAASAPGGVPEWLNGPVSKTGVPSGVPWVRIPPPPHETPSACPSESLRQALAYQAGWGLRRAARCGRCWPRAGRWMSGSRASSPSSRACRRNSGRRESGYDAWLDADGERVRCAEPLRIGGRPVSTADGACHRQPCVPLGAGMRVWEAGGGRAGDQPETG